MRHVIVAACCLLVVVACGNPTDPEGWAKRAESRSRLDEKLQALAEVRKAPGDRKAAVAPLKEILKQAPKARAHAALALGEIGDPSAAKALVEAIDSGSRDRDVLDANRYIADALGALRAKEAVPALTKLVGSPDGYVQVAAIDALGRIGDPAAVDALVAVATGAPEPFTAKKALLALGRIGDPRVAPEVMKLLFQDRGGVPLFPEASFAASLIGKPMAAPLLAVLEGKDAAFSAWAKERGIVQGALYAKSAQVLGDIGGADAVPALLSRLGYTDAEAGVQLYVRVVAAESLGRIRAKEAARPLADAVAREKDPNVRDRYCDALARIGDPSVLPALKGAAAAGDWDVREGPLVAVSRLGGVAELPFVEAARAKDCAKGCEPPRSAAYAGMAARLEAARACGADVACWAGKLADPSAAVRDRAALEVGRTGTAANATALGEAIVRPVADVLDVAARYHAVLALGWIAGREKVGAGAELAGKLDAMIAADRGRNLTAGVNEDAMRLATRLRR